MQDSQLYPHINVNKCFACTLSLPFRLQTVPRRLSRFTDMYAFVILLTSSRPVAMCSILSLPHPVVILTGMRTLTSLPEWPSWRSRAASWRSASASWRSASASWRSASASWLRSCPVAPMAARSAASDATRSSRSRYSVTTTTTTIRAPFDLR
eukprot:8871087-Pyramimonas_sp.AAC.1